MGDAWHQSLIREDIEFSPAEAIFGSQLVLPGQFINSAKPPLPSVPRRLYFPALQ
jgi:hypothetical protein